MLEEGDKNSKITVVLPLGRDIEQAFGFTEGEYEIAEILGTADKEETCQYNGGQCPEPARHFSVSIEAVRVDEEAIPVDRFNDGISGFLRETNREVHMCLAHLSKTLLENDPVIFRGDEKK